MGPAKPAPRAYSYLRFSTPEQIKGDSLRRQTALAESYAKANRLTLDTELSLRDLGVSAFRGDNVGTGALGAFLRAIGNDLVPRGSVLLVESLDRISRKEARKAVRILEDIVEAGVDVVTLNDGKRYTDESLSGTDFLIAILILMRAHEESLTKSKRIRAAWVGARERAAKRQIVTTRAPAWLKADGSASKLTRNATLTLIPDRAELIRRIFEMFLAGTGKKSIAKTFNDEGIPTWGAGKGRRPAKHWHGSYVLKILQNPATTGVFTPHVEDHRDGRRHRVPQQPIRDYYPRVIDDETFERVRTLLTARRKTVRTARVASIVAGLARCPKCNSTMTRVMKGRRGGVPKLVCTRAKAGAGCTYHVVKLPDVERAFVENAVHLRKPPIAQSTLAEEIDGADEMLYQVHKQIEALLDSIERKPSAALSGRLAEREAEADKLRADLKQLRERAAESESRVVALRAKRLAEAAAVLRPDNLAAANAALRECMESVMVDYPEGLLRLNWRHGPVSELIFDEQARARACFEPLED